MIASHPSQDRPEGRLVPDGGLPEDMDTVPTGGALAEGVDRVGVRVDEGGEPVEDLTQAVGLRALPRRRTGSRVP